MLCKSGRNPPIRSTIFRWYRIAAVVTQTWVAVASSGFRSVVHDIHPVANGDFGVRGSGTSKPLGKRAGFEQIVCVQENDPGRTGLRDPNVARNGSSAIWAIDHADARLKLAGHRKRAIARTIVYDDNLVCRVLRRSTWRILSSQPIRVTPNASAILRN